MPYASNNDLPPGVKDNLPSEAQTVYRQAFNSALKGSCKGEDSCAAKEAWTAVKNGWNKEGDKWVRKSSLLASFSFRINKAYIDPSTGERRWKATGSNTQKDLYDTRMSVDLFRDFIQRIKNKDEVPLQFRSEFWQGGLPYLSIAHYEDLGGWAAAGKATTLYIDGEYLKARGIFENNAVGRALYDAIAKDLVQRSEEPIRISIAFLDYGHKHGNIQWTRKSLTDTCPLCRQGLGDMVYNKGLLVHFAATRIPANEDTSIGLEGRSMAITSRKDDAESIVGEALAEELDEKSLLVGKSKATPALVVRAEGPGDKDAEDEPEDSPEERAKRKDVTPADKASAEKKYGDVEYADEENKKYPVDTEEHIQAAWKYISMPKNAAKYGDKGAAIKKKIIAAGKKKIGKDWPPSEATKESLTEESDLAGYGIDVHDTPAGENPVGISDPPQAPDYPYGGAISLADAKKYCMETSQAQLAGSVWTDTQALVDNIMQRSDVEDKPGAVKKLMAEINEEWKKIGNTEDTVTAQKAQKSMANVDKQVSDPIDESLAGFRSRVMEVRNDPRIPTPEDKLRLLQDDFAVFGEAVKKSIMDRQEGVEPNEMTARMDALEQQNRELVALISELKKMIPVSAPVTPPELAPFASSPVAPFASASLGIPQRRSIAPPQRMQPPVQAGTQRTASGMTSVHEIVRRSVLGNKA